MSLQIDIFGADFKTHYTGRLVTLGKLTEADEALITRENCQSFTDDPSKKELSDILYIGYISINNPIDEFKSDLSARVIAAGQSVTSVLYILTVLGLAIAEEDVQSVCDKLLEINEDGLDFFKVINPEVFSHIAARLESVGAIVDSATLEAVAAL